MKPLPWDKQLGLASPMEYAAIQSGKTKSPSNKEVGLDVSHHARIFSRGGEKLFFLTSSFIGRVILRVTPIMHLSPANSSAVIDLRRLRP
jgi:hypothetical protein